MLDQTGMIVAGVTLVFSSVLFYVQNGELLGSFAAAILATALVWLSYEIVRWTYLALRSKD